MPVNVWHVYWKIRCLYKDEDNQISIISDWLNKNSEIYTYCYNFGEGYPYLDITFYNQDDATLFKLRWNNDT
jgi:hypothetical protein